MYIRTKDGIYEVEQSQLEDDEEVVNCEYGQISKLEIKRKSENLEELCDEFVIIRDSTKINQLVRIDNIEYLKEMMKEDKRIVAIKGAIWTDWGLKYLANVNNDGGIELICT